MYRRYNNDISPTRAKKLIATQSYFPKEFTLINYFVLLKVLFSSTDAQVMVHDAPLKILSWKKKLKVWCCMVWPRTLLTANACFVRGHICCLVDWTFCCRNDIWRDLECGSIHAVSNQIFVCKFCHNGCTRICLMELWHGTCVGVEFCLVL